MSNLPTLPPLLPIQPFTEPARGEVTLPGSKSITNRALLLAALCDGPVSLTGALFSEDTEIMAEALRQLGFVVREDEARKTIYVEGRGGEIPAREASLHVGLAGTAARFLTALCAASKSGVYRLDGVPQMRKRPMKGLIDALRALGADIRCIGVEGFFPLEIHARGLRGGKVEIDASESSQMLSALLMVEPFTSSKKIEPILTKRVREPFVEMTRKMMGQFGFGEIGSGLVVPLAKGGGAYAIEADATAASYFLELPLVTGGALTLLKMPFWLTTIQVDGRAFIEVLGRVGELTGQSHSRGDSWEGIIVTRNPTALRRGSTENFANFSDTFLTLAAIAPLLDGPTTITGIAHTRKQETDRVAGMARELQKLGQGVVETTDSLSITPNLAEMKKRAQAGTIEIETYGDHRFAMSFAILGCHNLLGNGRPWLAIRNPACCAKTFPNFFDVLRQVWEVSHSGSNPTSLPPA